MNSAAASDDSAEVGSDRAREALLCQWALEAGFDRAGIATLEPSRYEQEFRGWIARGDHASMEWLGRRIDERTKPASRLDGARSAVCVAMHYPARDGEDNDLWQGVARYAHGVDYHTVMMERLRQLGDRIERSFPGTRSRSYVDTGPILERELGERAGLGKIAKNTMLLSRQGSYFLLGEVLLTLELEPSDALPDLCGNCTRCLDACPTDALPEPYRLDANRCISFWTIEHRGALPEGIAESLGEWSFGCDICQQVCPWNSDRNPRRQPGVHEQLELPNTRSGLDLVALATLERDRYTESFRGSALKRPKLEGLRRNAIAVLANRALGSLEPSQDLPKRELEERVKQSVEGLIRALATPWCAPESNANSTHASPVASQGGTLAPGEVVRSAALSALTVVAERLSTAGWQITVDENCRQLLEEELTDEERRSAFFGFWLNQRRAKGDSLRNPG